MMQEYDDDFFFEEDKINTSSAETNKIDKNLLLAKDNAPNNVQEDPTTSVEINDPFEDKIIIEEISESTECIFNDMRRDRYMIRHQDLM